MGEEGQLVDGRYRLIRSVGEGGMGAVFEATDLTTKKSVAIKLIRPEALSDRSLERFRREARYASGIDHPNVVHVLDSGVDGEEPYLVMELLSGASLDERLDELPPPDMPSVLAWIAQALDGLAAVHNAGIVHRDLKPANIFLSRDPAVVGKGAWSAKLVDFGLSRRDAASGEQSLSLTATHQFLGTPYYVSPEQVRSAKSIDRRADLFSMGVILYEAFAGKRPFDGPSASAVIAAIVADDPVYLREVRPDVPGSVCDVVHCALARKADDRYQTAEEMRAAVSSLGPQVEGLRAFPRERPQFARAMVSPRPSKSPTLQASNTKTASTASSGRGFGLLVVFGAVGVLGLLAGALFLAWAYRPAEPEAAIEPAVNVDLPPLAAGTFRLGEPVALEELAAQFRQLSVTERAGLTVGRARDGWVFFFEGTLADAGALAESGLGDLSPEPVPESAPAAVLRPSVVRTTASLNVRESSSVSGAFVRTLPKGTLAVAFLGEVSGDESVLGGQGSWAFVAPARGTSGWSASRFLERDGRCFPAGHSEALISRIRVHDGQRAFDAVMTTQRGEGGHSLLKILKDEGACELSEVFSMRVGGVIEDALVTSTAPNGGTTLLVLAWRGARLTGEETWSVFPWGQMSAVWEGTFRSGQVLRRREQVTVGLRRGPDGEPGYFPLSVRHLDGRREYFVWAGDGLVPLTE